MAKGEATRMTRIVKRRAVERCDRLAALGPPPAWWRVLALRRWLRAYGAIMAFDISESAEMLREAYTDEKLREIANAPNPFIAIAKLPAGERSAVGRWVEPVERKP